MKAEVEGVAQVSEGAVAKAGCGTWLDLGHHIVTRCGARPASRGGVLTLCPACFAALPVEAFARKGASS